MDEIEKIIEEMNKNKIVSIDSILQEKESIMQREQMLNSKLLSIQKVLLNKRQVIPKKFKKVEEIVSTKDIDKFYYNLVFYGFVDWDRYVGYLIKDTRNFYVKIKLPIRDWDNDELKEELLVTEKIADIILNYDDIIKEQERELLKYE